MSTDPLISIAVKAATYVSTKVAEALHGRLARIREAERAELARIEDIFGDPVALAKVYIEPNCQNVNPANINEEEPDAIVSTPIFKKLNSFFNGEFKSEPDGRSQLMVLSDAGMGKTSLLMIVKLSHLVPKQACPGGAMAPPRIFLDFDHATCSSPVKGGSAQRLFLSVPRFSVVVLVLNHFFILRRDTTSLLTRSQFSDSYYSISTNCCSRSHVAKKSFNQLLYPMRR
jgi:hypothetical protein